MRTLRTELGAGFHAFLSGRAEADQRADHRSHLLGLALREVRAPHALDPAVLVLADDDEVDEPDDVVLAQAVELGPDLAGVLVAQEADDE